MNRQEAIQTLSKVGKISVSYAEDLYDSFFEKPVNLGRALFISDIDFYNYESQEDCSKLKGFLGTETNQEIFARAWLDGYTVEKEPRYTVRIKRVGGYATHLNENLDNHEWFFASNDEIKGYRTKHTRKELEDADFGWVFSCPGVEVKEVEE